MFLVTIILIELTIQEMNRECQGNCFLYFQFELHVSLEKGYPLH